MLQLMILNLKMHFFNIVSKLKNGKLSCCLDWNLHVTSSNQTRRICQKLPAKFIPHSNQSFSLIEATYFSKYGGGDVLV